MRTTVCEIFLSGWRSSDNLEEAELHAPAHISQDSDSEHPSKVVSKSGKHSIYIHFPKDGNCEICLWTKMTRAPFRRRTGETLPRAEVWWLDYLITGSSMRRVNHGTITGALSLFKILPLNGFNLIHAKQRLHRRRKRVYESPRAVAKNKLFTRTIQWKLKNCVKIFPGIIEPQHLIDLRQMALLKEPQDEWKKEPQQYCCNQDWMEGAWLILWNAIATCEMSQTSWQTEKLRMKEHQKVILEESKRKKCW